MTIDTKIVYNGLCVSCDWTDSPSKTPVINISYRQASVVYLSFICDLLSNIYTHAISGHVGLGYQAHKTLAQAQTNLKLGRKFVT